MRPAIRGKASRCRACRSRSRQDARPFISQVKRGLGAVKSHTFIRHEICRATKHSGKNLLDHVKPRNTAAPDLACHSPLYPAQKVKAPTTSIHLTAFSKRSLRLHYVLSRVTKI